MGSVQSTNTPILKRKLLLGDDEFAAMTSLLRTFLLWAAAKTLA